jgi:hypothetical protein
MRSKEPHTSILSSEPMEKRLYFTDELPQFRTRMIMLI